MISGVYNLRSVIYILLIFAIPIFLNIKGYEYNISISILSFTYVCISIIYYSIIRFSILTWRSGIPIFYLYYFIIQPVILNNPKDNNWGLTISDISSAIYLATLGIISFFVGVITTRTNIESMSYKSNIYNILESVNNYKVIFILIIVGGVSNILTLFIGYSAENASATSEAGIVSVVSFFITIGMLSAFSNYYLTGIKKYQKLALLSLFIVVGTGFFQNSKGAILMPILSIAFLKYSIDRKLPYLGITLIFILYIFIVYPIVSSFRYVKQTFLSGIDNIELIKYYINYLISGEWFDFHIGDSSAAINDLDRGLLYYFGVIIRDSGTYIDFMGAQTYYYALVGLIPRFIMPDKPFEAMGNIMAQRYRVISDYDFVTNVSPTYMGEFYGSFGIFGLIFGMFLCGYLANYVDTLIIKRKVNWLLPIMIFAIGWQESIIGQSILPFLKNLITLILFLYLLYITKFIKINFK